MMVAGNLSPFDRMHVTVQAAINRFLDGSPMPKIAHSECGQHLWLEERDCN